jgi:two-component system, OmpR family, sensor histidine kinase VicK
VVGATDRAGPLPTAAGLAVAGAPVVAAALDGDVARGVVDVGDGNLAVIGAVPVAPIGQDGRPLALRQAGALALGRLLTAPAVVERVAGDTASDVAVVVGGDVVAATFPAEAHPDVAAIARSETAEVVEVAGTPRVVAVTPLGDPAQGQLVLALGASVVAAAGDTALRTTFLLAAIGLLVAGLLATVLARRIAGPVTQLTTAAEQVRAGRLDTRVAMARDDEVGRLAASFDGMTTALESRDRELRQALTTQAALRDRMETVTASMGEALLATDADGIVTTANPAAATLLGRTVEQLVGQPLAAVLHGRTDGGAELAGAALEGDDTQLRGELTGTGRLVEVAAAPLVRGEDGRVVVIRDITERVLADRVRTEVIANLSHELNTPLTPIKAFLEVVSARGGVQARLRPMLELAREGQARLERTVTALVDLAELEARKKHVTLEDVPVRDFVDAALARWRPDFADRRLTRRVRRDVPAVRTDPGVVGRILDELLDNARKFGTGAVRVLAERSADGGGGSEVVRITVRDDGPGIADDRLAEALDVFVQADGSSTRTVGGLGIGLPIATRLAALLGGRLELEPSPQGGLDATLVLPAGAEGTA